MGALLLASPLLQTLLWPSFFPLFPFFLSSWKHDTLLPPSCAASVLGGGFCGFGDFPNLKKPENAEEITHLEPNEASRAAAIHTSPHESVKWEKFDLQKNLCSLLLHKAMRDNYTDE